ncbi:DUF4232 domain-containing protein [Kitasatospora sp. NBC_01266]|uniref:DUF4232 domain-containing protein n=1 Tax=Kitasatospora sp. NBC_01266 TaxID=2903572 RepID=UPI002E3339F0|nr:DUF4232 domain-containing protein [Kitasatospora sp. NBC_01266]
MSRRPARTSIATATLVAAAATLALVGCSSSSSPSASGQGSSAPAAAGSAGSSAPGSSSSTTGGSSATTGGSSSTTGGSGTATTPGGSAGTGAPGTSGAAPVSASTPDAPAGPGACTSSDLSVAQSGAGIGAGQYYSTLVFTNTSSHSCTLAGYPGVSYVATAGQQSGNPATRTGEPYTTVTLAPKGTAKATLHDANGVGGYDPTQCQLSPAQGLRIYPPGEKASLFLPWQTQHCAGPTIHSLTIGPITS